MAMAMKPVSSFAILFILFLVIFEVPEIKAQDGECLKEYGGDVGYAFCAPRTIPTVCYILCRQNKDAKGGRCKWGDAGFRDVKCLCDYCSNEEPDDQILSGGI